MQTGEGEEKRARKAKWGLEKGSNRPLGQNPKNLNSSVVGKALLLTDVFGKRKKERKERKKPGEKRGALKKFIDNHFVRQVIINLWHGVYKLENMERLRVHLRKRVGGS